MDRKEFIKQGLLFSAGAAILPSFLSSCSKEEDFNLASPISFGGDVIVIGAGAAGLMAAYRLAQNNINVRVIEAGNTFGGRVKKTGIFTDFPIDLGAEWIHEEPSIFRRLLNDPDKTGSIDLIPYNPQRIKTWTGSSLIDGSIISSFFREYKFKSSTWYDFFLDHIVPEIGSGNMIYNSPVAEIDYSGNRVRITTTGNDVYEADKVLVTVPITILQDGDIRFVPALSGAKIGAINGFSMPGGIKVFMEFSEKFYPDIVSFPTLDDSDERIYYNVAFKKNTTKNVLGLFTVGRTSDQYTSIVDDQVLIDKILAELDEVFEGKASATYQKHFVQNWVVNPYIKGSYSFENPADAINEMLIPIDGKISFAGEALTTDASSTVHGAGFAGFNQIEALINAG